MPLGARTEGHLREHRPRPAGSAAASPARTAGLRRWQLRAARRFPPPASGSLRTPLPERRVPRPAPLPVVAGPYIRWPPALRSAASATAGAMLSRYRFLSRAFSRSLSAFQKVWYGRAGAPAGEKLAGGGRAAWGQGRGAPARPGTKGTGTRRPRAGRPRAAVALGAVLRSSPARRLPETAGAPSPAGPHPPPRRRSRLRARPRTRLRVREEVPRKPRRDSGARFLSV